MKPFIKWVGGKSKLIPQLLPLFPEKMATYYEPFLGGGAVFFHLAETQRFDRAVINDWNTWLVETYRVVRDFPTELLQQLQSIQDHYYQNPERVFKEWRNPDDIRQRLLDEDPILRAARFVCLNKTAFNGLFRVNKKGQFNTPWNKNPKSKICDASALTPCSEALGKFVTILQGDFETAVAEAVPGDCVYFDPPYVPLNVTSNFASYTAEGFGIAEQERLAKLVRALKDKGVYVVLSNSSAPIVYDLYKGLDIHEIDAPRAINSKGDRRGNIKEVVVVAKP